MNCKPGDLAVIVKGVQSGLLVNVLRKWRSGDCVGVFRNYLPDECITWLCESLGEPLTYGFIYTAFAEPSGPVPDNYLRPIRPGDVTDEEVRELFAPKQPEVA